MLVGIRVTSRVQASASRRESPCHGGRRGLALRGNRGNSFSIRFQGETRPVEEIGIHRLGQVGHVGGIRISHRIVIPFKVRADDQCADRNLNSRQRLEDHYAQLAINRVELPRPPNGRAFNEGLVCCALFQQREEIALQPKVTDGFKCAENVRRLSAKSTGGQQLDQCLIGFPRSSNGISLFSASMKRKDPPQQ